MDVIDVESRQITKVELDALDELFAGNLIPSAKEVAEAFAATEPMEPAEVARRVESLTSEMLKVFPAVDFPLVHHHADGLYARELTIPMGAFAIGAVQKYPHVSVISKGEISMLNEAGGITRIKAPCTMVSKPGVRKVGFAHEETVWTSIHSMADCPIEDPSKATNEELEAFICCKQMSDYLEFKLAAQERIEK